MRIFRTLVVTLALATAAPAFCADSPFVGKWTASAVTPGGDVSETVTCVKTADGYSITARLVVPGPPGSPEAGPGTDIKLEGNTFSYKRSVDLGGNALVITYSGVITGDTFTGEVDMGGMAKVPYKGVRVKE